MARKKITKAQKVKVDIMAACLRVRDRGIQIETDATHVKTITACFQNVTGFYLIQGTEGQGDKLRFTDIHPVYLAALKDKDFSAYVAADKVKKDAQGSSKGPTGGPSALKGQNTASDSKGGK